jgi:hypothetical protein
MMIAPIINTFVGIWLVYAAILAPTFVTDAETALPTLATGAVIVVLALASRRQPLGTWGADMIAILGSVLILQALLRFGLALPAVVNTWCVSWVGFLVAVLSLSTVLYRRPVQGSDQV